MKSKPEVVLVGDAWYTHMHIYAAHTHTHTHTYAAHTRTHTYILNTHTPIRLQSADIKLALFDAVLHRKDAKTSAALPQYSRSPLSTSPAHTSLHLSEAEMAMAELVDSNTIVVFTKADKLEEASVITKVRPCTLFPFFKF
jgi:hypothetical protein